MSVGARLDASGALGPGRLSQAGVAATAVLVVGLIVVAGFWLLVPAPPGPTPAMPFGPAAGNAWPSAGGVGKAILAWQAQFFSWLRVTIGALKTDGTALPILLAAGVGYGIFHAAGPGHGKAVIASYVVASERALLRGFGLSLAAALIQAAVAIGLVAVVFGVVGGTAATIGSAARIVEVTGFLLLVALGAVLVWRKAARVVALLGPDAVQVTAPGDPCACAPLDPAQLERGSLRQMALVALGAGIRPCAGAILVLTFTRSQGMFAVGVAATLAMALGTALTTGALAALAVYGKRMALALAGGRSRSGPAVGATVELAAAAFVVVLGLALLAGYWDGAAST